MAGGVALGGGEGRGAVDGRGGVAVGGEGLRGERVGHRRQRQPERRGQLLTHAVPHEHHEGGQHQPPGAADGHVHREAIRKDVLIALVHLLGAEQEPHRGRHGNGSAQEEEHPGHQVAAGAVDQAACRLDVRLRLVRAAAGLAQPAHAQQQGHGAKQQAHGQAELQEPQVQLVHLRVPLENTQDTPLSTVWTRGVNNALTQRLILDSCSSRLQNRNRKIIFYIYLFFSLCINFLNVQNSVTSFCFQNNQFKL